ncbi:hypothetical protein ACUN7V_17120 [Quadrisphaera oryzae]|uniref:hypothetical protein n=1 Tax=Quadrisphaera TaxID=317661 RepID=UPI001645FE24|nr:hypothetical protein [Quadrisphaera sp. RL12-1S]MBC3761823.1 hypothetical protein [Quadrisphaera sp. RL12-1S]
MASADDPASGTPGSDWSQHVEDCVDLGRAAVDDGLLASATSIETALIERRYTRGRRGGQWDPPPGPASGVISQLTPTSVDLQAGGQDDDALATTAEAITDRLVTLLGVPDSRGPVPDTDQVEALWERPDLAVVVSFLPSWSSQCSFAPGVTPTGTLWLRLSRPDVTDTEEDPERARHLARNGSSVERWHVAAQAPLPNDVVALLESDEDPTVVRAVRAGADRRKWLSTRP